MPNRRRTPLEVAKLKGAVKKDPQRYKNKPVKSKYGLGEPPKHMTKEAKLIWHEIAKITPAGVLTASERMLFEIVCDLMAEYRAPDSSGFSPAKLTILERMLGKLGMNPIDRQRLGVQPTPPKDGPTGDDDPDDFSKF